METAEEIGAKIDSLRLWEAAMAYNWGVKPHGVAFPYFCTILRDDGPLVSFRLLMLDGWRTLHDFARTRADRNFGFYSSPMEMPHFELIVLRGGGVELSRNDPGFAPRRLDERERELVAKILWESYGVMMRLESDKSLAVKYAGENAMFARVEAADGTWSDAPLHIPPPPPHTETVSLSRALVAKAKDMPFEKERAVEMDFRINPALVTKDARQRLVYTLAIADAATGEALGSCNFSVAPKDGSLADLWQPLAGIVLERFVSLGWMPGEMKTMSGRLFRMLRPLCLELPVKLSLHDSLPALSKLQTKGKTENG